MSDDLVAPATTIRRGGHMMMNGASRVLMAFAVVGTLSLASSAQPKGERITVTGEVVDMWCYLEGGDRGPAKKACATACAKAGNPIGILDNKGSLYLAAGLKDHEPAQVLLLDKLSSEVTVTGTLVRGGGVQMLYVESIRPKSSNGLMR